MTRFFKHVNYLNGKLIIITDYELRYRSGGSYKDYKDFETALLYWKVMNDATEVEEEEIIHLP